MAFVIFNRFFSLIPFKLHTASILTMALVAGPMLFLISCSDVPFSVMVAPKYLNLLTCSSTSPPMLISSLTSSYPLADTMVLLFSLLIIPNLVDVLCSLFVSSCSSASSFPSRSMSSAKQRLHTFIPPQLIPASSRSSMASIMIL